MKLWENYTININKRVHGVRVYDLVTIKTLNHI